MANFFPLLYYPVSSPFWKNFIVLPSGRGPLDLLLPLTPGSYEMVVQLIIWRYNMWKQKRISSSAILSREFWLWFDILDLFCFFLAKKSNKVLKAFKSGTTNLCSKEYLIVVECELECCRGISFFLIVFFNFCLLFMTITQFS